MKLGFVHMELFPCDLAHFLIDGVPIIYPHGKPDDIAVISKNGLIMGYVPLAEVAAWIFQGAEPTDADIQAQADADDDARQLHYEVGKGPVR